MRTPDLLDLFETPLPDPPPERAFAGSDYVVAFDHARLRGQMRRVYEAASDGRWRTLGELSAATGDPEASVSAQLRHLKKRQWGSHTVEKRRRGSETSGLWEYRLRV